MIVLRVVDVANVRVVLELHGLVDGAEGPCAQEADLEEFGGGREVAWVLLVAEVAGGLGWFGGEGRCVDFGG